MGLDFNGLPKELQTKLAPYFTVGGAKSVEEAIQKAKDAKVWTAADDAVLNGNKNWGRVMDEYAFSSSKAEEYKKNMPEAQKQNQIAEARRRRDKQKDQKEELEMREARKEENRNLLAEVGKGILALTPLGWVACQNDTNEQIQIVKEKDYTTLLNTIIKEIKGLRSDIDNLRTDVNSGFNKLSDNDKLIINGLDRIFLEIQNFENSFEVSQKDMKDLLKNVEAWLKQIETNQESQIELQIAGGKTFATFVQQLFDILNNKNMDDAAKFDAILNKMQEIKDVDTSILAKLDAMFDDSKIIAAIKELSNQVAGANNTLTLIYNAIMKHGKNSDAIKALLEQVLKNQETQIKNNSAGFKAVIDAISKIPANEPVDLSTLENLMKQLVALSADNGVKLDGIAKQNDIIITILKSLGAKMDGFDAWFEKIYNKIPAGGEGGCKLDFEKLMAKLQEILEAIKDHDVHVTVDVTGKVECHCGCKDGNGKVHEGVIGNLNDLLG